jgi:TolA-binding protein
MNRSRPLRLILLSVAILVNAFVLKPGAALGQRGIATPEEAFSSAFALYGSRLYERAAEAFGRFVEAHPDHPNTPEALYYQAESTLGAGFEEEATRLYIAFYERYPVHPLAFQARLALGKYFFDEDQYDKAIESLRRVIDDEPDPEVAAKAWYWMGEAAFREDREEEGLQYLQTAAEQYRGTSTAPMALYAIAFRQNRRNRPAEAARAFELLSIRYPESPLATEIGLGLAESYYELGEYDRALRELLQRFDSLRGEAEQRATFLLAECYNHLGRHEEAIVHYRRFTEGNPASQYYRRALYGLAWNYHFARDYSAAAATFAQVYGREGKDELAGAATYYRGVNLKLTGRHEEAAQMYRAAAEGWPSGNLADRAWFELGMALYELRRWQEAERAFSEVQKSYPRSEALGEALRMAGEARVAQGDFSGAERAYSEAISLATADPGLRDQVSFQKAWLSYRTGKYAEAAPAFLALYRSNPAEDVAGDALFWAAESHYQTRDYGQADRLFNQFLRQFRNHRLAEAAHYAVGWTYFRQGRYSAAIESFQRFLRTHRDEPGNFYGVDARLRLADSYYAVKRYDDAVREYGRVTGDDIDYALFQKGQALAQLGRADEAIKTLRELIEDYDYSEWREEALYTIGYLDLLSGSHDDAVETFTTLVQRFPQHPLAAKGQYGIGDSYYNRGQWEEAIQAYRVVLERFPTSPYVVDAVGSLSYALSALDRPNDIDEIIDSFASRNPNSPYLDQLRFRKAEVKYQSGQLAESIAEFQRFIRESRSEALAPQAYLFVARAYETLGQTNEAAAYLQQIVRRYPASTLRPEAEQRLGAILLDEGDYEEALRLYRSARQSKDADPAVQADALYGEGMALLGTGRIADAEALLQSAAEGEGPQALPAKLGMARILDQRGRYPEAEQYYRDVAESSADERGAEALYRLGVMLLRQGRPAQALDELGRLEVLFAGLDQWMARGYLAQADAFRALGQNGNADRMYESVILQFPGTPWAAAAEQQRKMLTGGP